ncbi:MAG: glycerol dehydrogenase [Prolixibacteraceae bacterium]|nr:glycerol dehydrogenase [Prolixibacteraceae bacterium]
MKQQEYITAAFPGKYIQGENAFQELPKLIRLFGQKAMIIASPSVINRVLPRYSFPEKEIEIVVEKFVGECCESELARLSSVIAATHPDVIVGMGGGKTIDSAKIVADRARIPVIVAPTIASTDAPCSGVAIIYSEDGVFDSVYYTRLNPPVVLVDTSVIANAPARFLVAGMGDAMATWFEARSCYQSHSLNVCGGYSTLTGLNLAKLCFDTLLQYGPAAKLHCEQNRVTPELSHIVEANTLLSGIGFESSGLAAAHAIHNGLSALTETHSFYHGEKVAFGVVTGLHLTGASPEEMETVYSFFEKVGLPTCFSDIGIIDITHDKLQKVAAKACVPEETIHHEVKKVTPEKVLKAMVDADTLGIKRKKT